MSLRSRVCSWETERICAALLKEVYPSLRGEFSLKSQMAYNVVRQVTGTYRTLQQQIKIKKSEWQKIEFAPTIMTFSFRRDFTIDGDQIGLTTLEGRKIFRFHRYPHMVEYLDKSAHLIAMLKLFTKPDVTILRMK